MTPKCILIAIGIRNIFSGKLQIIKASDALCDRDCSTSHFRFTSVRKNGVSRIKASTTMEAIVSVAIISALMVIIFPFFGQVLNSNHRMEIVRGLHLQNEIKQQKDYNPFQTGTNEFSGEGITIRQSTIQDNDFPQLYHITTEFISSNKKTVYSITEIKYHP